MAVIFYGEGDHDSGFVGFRVATTLGSDDEYRQKYYSLNNYNYIEARSLAYAQDAEWREEAEDFKRSVRFSQRRASWGKNIIVEGLRAYIGIENRVRSGETRTYFYPAFYVTTPGYGKGDTAFRTSVHGYQKAYELAVDEYSRRHDLVPADRNKLLEMIPCETVFSEYLLEKIRKRGHEICKYEMLDKLI